MKKISDLTEEQIKKIVDEADYLTTIMKDYFNEHFFLKKPYIQISKEKNRTSSVIRQTYISTIGKIECRLNYPEMFQLKSHDEWILFKEKQPEKEGYYKTKKPFYDYFSKKYEYIEGVAKFKITKSGNKYWINSRGTSRSITFWAPFSDIYMQESIKKYKGFNCPCCQSFIEIREIKKIKDSLSTPKLYIHK